MRLIFLPQAYPCDLSEDAAPPQSGSNSLTLSQPIPGCLIIPQASVELDRVPSTAILCEGTRDCLRLRLVRPMLSVCDCRTAATVQTPPQAASVPDWQGSELSTEADDWQPSSLAGPSLEIRVGILPDGVPSLWPAPAGHQCEAGWAGSDVRSEARARRHQSFHRQLAPG